MSTLHKLESLVRDRIMTMKCDYFTQDLCRSCTWIGTPYREQVRRRQTAVATLLATVPGASHIRWLPAAESSENGYRTKAKMAVGGRIGAPTLGLLDANWDGVDLEHCPILHPHIRTALPLLREFIASNRLQPYNVGTRQGELKYVIVTADLRGGLMVRFVLRSRNHEALLRSRVRELQEQLPLVQVVTINLHPRHAAVIEGDEEIVLTEQATLPMLFGDVELHVGPRSFTQTNTLVAGQLYRQLSVWMSRRENPREVWDLYCGVGGFALHAALGGATHVTGVEISDSAVASAKVAATQIFGEQSASRVTFIAEDARSWALSQTSQPEVLIVNPPRRGIGADFAHWVNSSAISTVVYSSCNPKSLAADLQIMDSYRVVEGRLFDMFPHTDHSEVAVLLEKITS